MKKLLGGAFIASAAILGGAQSAFAITISGPATATVGTTVNVTINASDCTRVAYKWGTDASGYSSQGDRENEAASASINVSLNIASAEEYGVVAVCVNEGGGVVEGTWRNYEVDGVLPPPNVLPVAAATGTPASGAAPLIVNFNGSGSTDSDGTIASYSWNFGDGTPAGTGATTSHTYAAAGNYTATLTVTDNRGGTNSTTVAVTVSAPAPVTTAAPPTTAGAATTAAPATTRPAPVTTAAAATTTAVAAAGGGRALPTTGSSSWMFAGVAGLFVIAGGITVSVRRRSMI